MTEPKRLLILGGTGLACDLAERATDTFSDRIDITSSLAGRTENPRTPPGNIRQGGFGGGPGLADYLKQQSIDMVIDATHPFAEQISANAYDACLVTETPRLTLTRPPWTLPGDARWIEAATMAEAAGMLNGFARRVFLTTGIGGIEAFAGLDDIHFVVRLIETPAEPLPLADHELVIARPPFTVDDEARLLVEHDIDTLVSKHSGGDATVAKIAAAIQAGTKLVLIARPLPEPGEAVETIDAALSWLESRL
ncbi:MAG: cobalt-precorrin-6A reductase [Alphaproteobacteria bacterium]